jgi:hypothetical protein
MINPEIDPITGMPIQQNRAGAPGRSINDLQDINTIQDPGMQSAQQAAAFQKFNNIAQYTPPPTMKLVGGQDKIDANNDGEITGEDFKILKK